MSLSKEVENWAQGEMPIYEYIDLRISPEEGDLFRVYVALSENACNHIKTMHAAVQFAAAEALGATTVFARRESKDYTPVVRKITIEYKKPAITDIVSETIFTAEDAAKLNSAMKSVGRYDFDLEITVKNTSGEVISIASASYAVRDFAKYNK